MKRYLMMLAAVTLVSGMAWAQDGAGLYKAKCAMCHGAMGEGKIGPSPCVVQAQLSVMASCGFRFTIPANVRNGTKPHITVLREQFRQQPEAGSASEFC